MSLVFAAACGGSKPPPTSPLPGEPAPAAASPAPAAAAEPAQAPPAEPDPVELRIPAFATTVKVISGGKGKKEPVRYSAKQGTKQTVEVAMDFTGMQDADEQIVPTIVLTGEAETKSVDNDGNAEYTLTVTGTDARPVTGSKVQADNFKTVLGSIAGLTIGGKLGATGAAGETTLRIAKPTASSAEALDLIRLTFPTLPVLPKDPIGVGAKWQSTTAAKLADRLDVTQVTNYELIAHTGTTWRIKGTTKVTGKDQSIDTSTISSISGAGTSETTIAAGELYPTFKSSLETKFKASEKDQSTQFTIRIGGAVTPKTP